MYSKKKREKKNCYHNPSMRMKISLPLQQRYEFLLPLPRNGSQATAECVRCTERACLPSQSNRNEQSLHEQPTTTNIATFDTNLDLSDQLNESIEIQFNFF